MLFIPNPSPAFAVLGQFFPGKLPPGQCPLGQLSLTTIASRKIAPPDNFHLGKLLPRQLSPREMAPWTNPPDNSHLGLFYCPRIITSGQLLPRAMAITNYNFFIAIFCFFSMSQLYNFYFLLKHQK